MELIDANTAEAFLRRAGWIAPDARVQVEQLTGGVSNEVLYVAQLDGAGEDFVLKQARPQLRTAAPWFCPTERIWREAAVLRICAGLTSRTPKILYEDRASFVLAMTAAPPGHRTWKSDLLAGQADESIAEQCGSLLADIHAGTWGDASAARELDDREYFDQLRLDPYYRQVGRVMPEAARLFDELIETTLAERHCLVHADFSPKNLLTWPEGLMMVDFETGHYGDPAFDLGFFLSHLVLKAYYHAPRHAATLRLADAFWRAYAARMHARIEDEAYAALVARGLRNLAGCAWARLDGKSQIDYLNEEGRRDAVRALCRRTLVERPTTWDELAGWLSRSLQELA